MAVCKCRLGICEITTVSLLKVAIESIGRVNIEYRIISSKTLSRGTPIWILRNWMVDRSMSVIDFARTKRVVESCTSNSDYINQNVARM